MELLSLLSIVRIMEPTTIRNKLGVRNGRWVPGKHDDSRQRDIELHH